MDRKKTTVVNLEADSDSSDEETPSTPAPAHTPSTSTQRSQSSRGASSSSAAKLPISIRTLCGKTIKVEARTDWTVRQLKQEFENWRGEGSAASCTFFYRAKRLADNERLSTYKIEPDSIIQANFRSTGGLLIINTFEVPFPVFGC